MKQVAVIGGGWYGCHIALALKEEKDKYNVTIFERENDIFKGISGKFGIRLHTGLHYPRSEKTRKSCQEGFKEFIKTYPNLVVEHAYSIYGLGNQEAKKPRQKIDLETFKKIGKEINNSREIDPIKWGFCNLQSAFEVEEPSIVVGDLLREQFSAYLKNKKVKVKLNSNIIQLQNSKNAKIIVKVKPYSQSLVILQRKPYFRSFDYVVNTTSYQTLLPSPDRPLPFGLNIIYQPCLALVYVDNLAVVTSLPPFSFIVVDGMFPCIMPYIEAKEKPTIYSKYIVTHGQHTILGSYKTMKEAKEKLEIIDENFIEMHVKRPCEEDMKNFWPPFGACLPESKKPRFEYRSFLSSIIAKPITNREFRSAITYKKERVLYVIPGKVSNIIEAGREALILMNAHNADKVVKEDTFEYVKSGVLHEAFNEITEPVDPKITNTGFLQPYEKELKDFDKEKKANHMDQSKYSLKKMPNFKLDILQNKRRRPSTHSLPDQNEKKIHMIKS